MLKANQLIESTLFQLAFWPVIRGLRIVRDVPPFSWIFLWWLNWRVPAAARRRHTLVTGRSGSGKSEVLKLLACSTIKKQNATLVILDPHGDLVEEVAKFKWFRHRPEKLVYIDPCLRTGFSPTLNPLDLEFAPSGARADARIHKHGASAASGGSGKLNDQEIDLLAQEITRAFAELLKKSALTLQMEALLMPCVATLLRRPGSDFSTLQRFMQDGQNQDLVELGCQSPNPAQARFFGQAFLSKGYWATKHSLFTKLQSLLNSKTFYHLTTGPSTLDLEALLNQKRVLLFNLSKGRMGADASEAYGRLLLARIQAFALRRAKIPKPFRTPVHLFIDEFHSYVSPSIEIILAEARKYGLHLTLASQTVGQNMDESLRDLVMSNTSVKIIGMNAPKSLNVLSKDTGIEFARLQRLGVRQFFIKPGAKNAFRIYAPGFLANQRGAMREKDWKLVLKSIISRFYRPIGSSIETNSRTMPMQNQEEAGKLAFKPKFPL